MSKGNMLLGYARGKVGDLVFTRLDGVQVTRPRNRHPANPRTNKQLIQRAIMATVMGAYSAGKEIFDHSFQGYSVGAGNQRRFLSLNANMLRTQLSVDFENATPEEALAKVTAPKIQTPIPNQYVVAEGSLMQSLLTSSINAQGDLIYNLPEIVADEKISEYAQRLNMNAGDIYTFVFMLTKNDDENTLYKALGVASVSYDTIYRGSFGWLRLIVKNLAGNDTVITDETLITDLFDVEVGGVAKLVDPQMNIADDISMAAISDYGDYDDPAGYALGVIRSRRDVDLRSNCTLQVINPAEFGLYWNDILTAWQAGTVEIGSSDLILEGGDE